MNALDSYLESNSKRHLDEFFDFLRIPSISTDPAHSEDVDNCADFLVQQFKSIGFQVEKVATDGHPIVYAEWLGAPDKPTVLYYGHYDVQPPDPLELWDSPPFEPTIRDGAVVARGASDDKGQVFAHIKAFEALMAIDNRMPINIKVLIEGEEESGSSNLDPFIKSYRDRLNADVVLVSDTAMFDRETPSICYGLRGLAYFQINVTGPSRDLHSGSFGGAVDNPINALCYLINRLKDRDGVIQIPGFYDSVLKLSDTERQELSQLPFDEPAFLGEVNAKAFGERGFSTLERIGARPALDVNGIWGGYTGEGAKTVLPSKAHAKVSMRLVPNQSPAEIAVKFQDYLNTISPDSVQVSVESMHGGEPSVSDRSSPFVAASSRALEALFGKPPLFVREGGSIPVVSSFNQILGLDTILAGFGLANDRIHSPNEKFELDCFRTAARFGVRVWHEMAQ